MQLAIAGADDLVALYGVYLALIERGDDDRLELVLAPGDYGAASIGPIALDLGGDPRRVPDIDVVIRSTGAVLHDLGATIRARSVEISGLTFTGRRQAVLDVRAAQDVTLRDCAVVGNEWGGPWRGALIKLIASTVAIEDSWLVGNSAQSAAALVEIAPATGSHVERVALRRVGLIGNTTESDVLVREARAVTADELIAVKDHASGVVIRHERSGKVVVEHSAFVVSEPAALAAEDTRTWSSGLELVSSQVRVAGASRKLPPGVRGAGTPIEAATRAPTPAFIDELAATIARERQDAAALRAHLRAALGV